MHIYFFSAIYFTLYTHTPSMSGGWVLHSRRDREVAYPWTLTLGPCWPAMFVFEPPSHREFTWLALQPVGTQRPFRYVAGLLRNR